MMAAYRTLESWASRFGYVVEQTPAGYVWHAENEPASPEVATAAEVVEAILRRLKSEYEGLE
jgi:hypothetical protein